LKLQLAFDDAGASLVGTRLRSRREKLYPISLRSGTRLP